MAAGHNVASYWLSQPRPYYNRVALVSGGSETYTVSIVDNSANPAGPDTDGLVAIQSTGTSGGASRTVTLLVQPSAYAPLDAVRVTNQLRISGSPLVQGACGSVHIADAGSDSTVDIDLRGTPVVQQGVSTSGAGSGDYIKSVFPVLPGALHVSPTQTVARPVPTIDPKKYAKYADYFLNDNGYAYQWTSSAVDVGTNWCATTPCGDPSGWTKLTPAGFSPGSCVVGWQRQSAPTGSGPALWVDCGASGGGGGTPGTFYVRGAVKMTHSPGTLLSPYRVTLIAEASIDMTGSPHIVWDDLTTTSTPPSINPNVPKDVLFVAGTDLNFSGSAGAQAQGVIAAHEQVDISGSGSLLGSVLAEDACHGLSNWPTCDGHVTENRITGGPSITYNCGMQPAEMWTLATIVKWITE